MVTKIDINIPNYNLSISNPDDISNIIRIIRPWKEIYYKKYLTDETYTITIYANEIVTYKFTNSFPDDFFLLVDYLGEHYGK